MIEIKTGENEQRMQTFQEMIQARQKEFKDHFYMKAERSVTAFLSTKRPIRFRGRLSTRKVLSRIAKELGKYFYYYC
jgi:hypothetical protein